MYNAAQHNAVRVAICSTVSLPAGGRCTRNAARCLASATLFIGDPDALGAAVGELTPATEATAPPATCTAPTIPLTTPPNTLDTGDDMAGDELGGATIIKINKK